MHRSIDLYTAKNWEVYAVISCPSCSETRLYLWYEQLFYTIRNNLSACVEADRKVVSALRYLPLHKFALLSIKVHFRKSPPRLYQKSVSIQIFHRNIGFNQGCFLLIRAHFKTFKQPEKFKISTVTGLETTDAEIRKRTLQI